MKIEISKIVDQKFDVAVVIPTIIRPELTYAVRSIFNQSFKGSIQILIGIDWREGKQNILDNIMSEVPENVTITVVDPGYSTSARHGGVHSATDGGSLRTVLSFLAHSRYVAYLDDDNWWHIDHLKTLLEAIQGVDWAFSYRWLVDEKTNKTLALDKWHSTGPGKGVFNKKLGGFVDPNTLIVDKLTCADQLHLWSVRYGNSDHYSGADRWLFQGLVQNKTWRPSNCATVFYKIMRNRKLWKIAYADLMQRNQEHSRNPD
jgi:hypothetical protein